MRFMLEQTGLPVHRASRLGTGELPAVRAVRREAVTETL